MILTTLGAGTNLKPVGNSSVSIKTSTSQYSKGGNYMGKLKFNCNYCPASFEQVKQLFDHYEAEHRNWEFKRYKVKHIPSGERGMATAPTPEEACARLCWDIKDCEVKEALTGDSLAK